MIAVNERVHRDEAEQRRQQDQQQRDAVHAEEVLRAHRGDPLGTKDELKLRPPGRRGTTADRDRKSSPATTVATALIAFVCSRLSAKMMINEPSSGR